MNIKLGLLTLGLLLFQQVSAQRVIDKGNCREGENVEYCTQHKKLAEMMTIPGFAEQYALDQAELNNPTKKDDGNVEKATLYKIPVVFHVLHNNGVENITDEQIHDALAIMNRDYRKLNADAALVQSEFIDLVADIEVEFEMATKAPDGTCFNGITRTVSPLTADGEDGWAQVQEIAAENDVYQGEWPGNRYLNIFICQDIGGAAGYTYKPSNWIGASMGNGIWVLHNYVGSIGTSSVYSSRTLTHEVGHWLNLDHVWGGTNNPALATNCSSDDAVSDTPNCIGSQSCNLNANTCNVGSPNDLKDPVENYMDYSYCSKMFTEGQKTRMRNALTSSTGGRNNLWTASNRNLVGAGEYADFCVANFSSDKFNVCVGDQVQFMDQSFNNVTGWTWTFEGGSPASSTEQNPIITYNTPGTYQVVLTATDGASNITETKTEYIIVQGAGSIPFLEGFEAYTTLADADGWVTDNPDGNAEWEITNTAAHTGAKSVKLSNYGQGEGFHDELLAAPVDLSSIGAEGATFSFRYAYSKRTSGDTEWLKVFFSPDCGDAWHQRKTLYGNLLGQNVATSAWTPTSSDWVTVHVNILDQYFISNFKYKFRFESDNGNNIFLDNINIYAGGSSDDLVDALGIDEQVGLEGIVMYPNPTADEVNIKFTTPVAQDVVVEVTELTGKQVQQQYVKAQEGTNIVMMDSNQLSAGVYMVNIVTSTGKKAMRLVKK